MNAFDATVTAYAEVGRDLWTDVKDCASLGLAFVSPDEVCLALPADQLGELSFPPEEVPPLPEGCLFVWWAAGQPRELARLARQFASRGFTHVAWQRFLRGPQVHVFPIDQLTNNTKR
ncbi:hypothetical protein [Akkermansia sp.]|uniref:hypothetical protein n=1 Tax=Akkermansia sp. TaxID=1872421 RepID=UPI003AF16CBC